MDADVRIVDDVFVFSLEGLQSLVDPEATVSASGFRKLLYSSNLASRISQRGGEFGIHQNTGKVAGNRYYLKPTPP